MTAITMESIGLTKEELQERVIEALVGNILRGNAYDPDTEDEVLVDSDFKRRIDEKIKAAVETKINAMFEAHVLPNVAQYIDNLTLQERTKWGEKKGQPMSFVEYLVSRAEHYITEEVNYEGKSREDGGYSWSKHSTRITHLIHEHLKYEIQTAMNTALKEANKTFATGLQRAVNIALNEAIANTKVVADVKQGR